jgi:sugar lactone lactonase YvrE
LHLGPGLGRPASRRRGRAGPGGEARETLGRGELHRRGRAGRGRRDPLLRHRRPDPAVRPRAGTVSTFREPSGRANGLIFDPQGRLIAAEGANTGGNRRVSITERDGTVRTLADRYGGKRFNSPNDLAVDAQGRVYVSDPRYVGAEPRALEDEAVYRIDPDGTVAKLATTASKPNGLAVSPDGTRLYVSDNGPRRAALLALDLDPSGAVARPRVLKDFGNGRGIDGMTVTADGRIVAAAGAGILAGVYVYAPTASPGLHRHARGPDQRRVRRPPAHDPLHHRRHGPVPDRDHPDRPPPLAAPPVPQDDTP